MSQYFNFNKNIDPHLLSQSNCNGRKSPLSCNVPKIMEEPSINVTPIITQKFDQNQQQGLNEIRSFFSENATKFHCNYITPKQKNNGVSIQDYQKFNQNSSGLSKYFKDLKLSGKFKTINHNQSVEENLSSSLSKDSRLESEMSNQKQSLMCPIHPNKKVKYQLLKNVMQKFCSKCALNFALKGEKIEEMPDDGESLKKNETDNFLSKLYQIKQHQQTVLDSYENRVTQLKEYYASQIDKINSIFVQAERLLHEEKTNIVANINKKMWECINQIDEVKNKSRIYQVDLEKFKLDIEKNYDNIIKEMEIKPFKDIIDKYTQKLNYIEQYLSSLTEGSDQTELVEVDTDYDQIEQIKEFFSKNIIKLRINPNPLQLQTNNQMAGTQLEFSSLCTNDEQELEPNKQTKIPQSLLQSTSETRRTSHAGCQETCKSATSQSQTTASCLDVVLKENKNIINRLQSQQDITSPKKYITKEQSMNYIQTPQQIISQRTLQKENQSGCYDGVNNCTQRSHLQTEPTHFQQLKCKNASKMTQNKTYKRSLQLQDEPCNNLSGNISNQTTTANDKSQNIPKKKQVPYVNIDFRIPRVEGTNYMNNYNIIKKVLLQESHSKVKSSDMHESVSKMGLNKLSKTSNQ